MHKPWTKFYDEGVPESLKPYPEHPLYVFLEQTAAKYPHKPAIHFKPSHQGFAKSSLTYAQLNDLSDRMAAALAALGVKKGDRVAVFMPNIPQFVIAFYGVLKVGGVVVATNPAYTEPEIEHQLKDSGAETMICMSLFYPKVQKVLANTQLKNVIVTNIKDYMSSLLRLLFTLAKERKDGHRVELSPGHLSFMELMAKYSPSQRPKVDVGPDDRALFQYSGGTTGVPKAAIALHRHLVANTLQIRAWFSKCREGEETMLLARLLIKLLAYWVLVTQADRRFKKQPGMEILKNKKILSIIIGLFLILAVAGWIAAGIQKSKADRSRGEVDALGKKIEEMKAENLESDRAWKDKLYEAEKKYAEAEKRRRKAASEFSGWKPSVNPPPGTVREMVRRFGVAGIKAMPRGTDR